MDVPLPADKSQVEFVISDGSVYNTRGTNLNNGASKSDKKANENETATMNEKKLLREIEYKEQEGEFLASGLFGTLTGEQGKEVDKQKMDKVNSDAVEKDTSYHTVSSGDIDDIEADEENTKRKGGIMLSETLDIVRDDVSEIGDLVQPWNGLSGSSEEMSGALMCLEDYEAFKAALPSQEEFVDIVTDMDARTGQEILNLQKESLKGDEAQRDADTSSYTAVLQMMIHKMKYYSRQVAKCAEENSALLAKNQALLEQLQEEKEDKEERIKSLKERLTFLEKEASEYQEDAKQSRERLAAHDAAAKRAITTIQNECSIKVSQVSKMFEDAVVEKDGLLIKISKVEDEHMHAKKLLDSLEKRNAELSTEMNRIKQHAKDKDIEVKKAQVLIETKEKDLADAKTEIGKLKEEVNSTAVKIKWAQNKLKQELESHKETKKQVTLLTTKLQEAKEEGEQIRQACQEMIKQYQDSEEMKSVQLDHKLKETENAVKLHEHEIAVQDEAHRLKTQELEALKASHRKAKEKILEMQAQIASLEDKRSADTAEVVECRAQLQKLHQEKSSWEGTSRALEESRDELKRYDQQVRYYQTLENNLRADIQELSSELKACRQKEAELLNFSEKLADNNAQAMTSAKSLESKLSEMTSKNAELERQLLETRQEHSAEIRSIMEQRESEEKTMSDLSDQLSQKEKIVNELSSNLEDAQDEVRVIKRKNAAALKDLQRQLQQSKKKMEQMEFAVGDSQENLSNKSRTSSNCSLDKLSSTSPHYASDASLTGIDQTTAEYSIVQPSKLVRGNHVKGEIDVDKSLLVERICKLQKAHAKKNDKLEFLEEHINTLVEELQRKNRIIQFYIEREEAGTLAPSQSDRNKAEISRKGGIMASVYSSRPSDKDMTLDLSLEINRKLQAVLEDTLLKNITLKESINTLGEEISKLQREKTTNSNNKR